MPRLTTKQYLSIHRDLRQRWLQDMGDFSYLSSAEQWHLHDFFVPDKDLTDEQLIELREMVSAKWPNLPQQAGRALAHLDQVLAALLTHQEALELAPDRGRRVTAGFIQVRAVVRPEPDYQKLAHALL